jgi:uncharacterized membrane protein YtjA (UPF0391 family)
VIGAAKAAAGSTFLGGNGARFRSVDGGHGQQPRAWDPAHDRQEPGRRAKDARALARARADRSLLKRRSPAQAPKTKEIVMLGWSLGFFIVAVLAAILGFWGIAGTAAGIAKVLFFAFLVIAVVALVMGRRPMV